MTTRPDSIPVFGEKNPGANYIPRPGAYAVIFDGQKRVAAMRDGSAYFLPGGGLEERETLETALHRELLEECAATIEILDMIGHATDFIHARDEDIYFEKRGTFYFARFTSTPVSKNLAWLPPDQVSNAFRQEGHVWAVMRALDRKIPDQSLVPHGG